MNGLRIRTAMSLFGAACMLLLFACTAQAATKYVTPTGAGLVDGSDWANAYSNVQDAVDACPADGDAVYIKYGVYTNDSQIAVSNHLGLTIRGGYVGSGAPGAFTNDVTVLTRDPSVTNRIFYGQDSILTLDRLSITNGLLIELTNHVYGAGLFLDNCETVVTNCVIEANRLPVPYRNPAIAKNHYGSGIYANAGTLTIVSSQVRDNGHSIYSFQNCGSRHGDGVCAVNVTVTLSDVLFEKNLSGSRDGDYGCALYLSGSSASISDCHFNTNRITACYTGNGAAIYATGVSPLNITNCTFRGNYISGPSVYKAYGGALWIGSCYPLNISDCIVEGSYIQANNMARGSVLNLSGSTLLGTISDCTIEGHTSGNGSETIYVDNTSPSAVSIQRVRMKGALDDGVTKVGTGTLALTNCLIYVFAGDGIQADAGTVTLVNSTVVDNGGWGVTNASGVVTSRNCIAWGNTAGGFTTNCSLIYTDSQEVHAGEGNKNADPLFVDASINNYHLTEASPCVGTGTNETWMIAAVDLDGNDRIKGGRVDMGVYEVMPPAGTVITIR